MAILSRAYSWAVKVLPFIAVLVFITCCVLAWVWWDHSHDDSQAAIITATSTATATSTLTTTSASTPAGTETEVTLQSLVPTEVPSQTPTEAPTKEPTQVPTSVPAVAPTKVPVAQPTSIPVPTQPTAGLIIDWNVTDGSSNQPLTQGQVVAIVTFNGVTPPLYLNPDPNEPGKITYSQASAASVSEFGMVSWLPLEGSTLKPYSLKFQIQGNRLVLLNPRHSSLDPLEDQTKIKLYHEAPDWEHSEVYQSGCRDYNCAMMTIQTSGMEGPDDDIGCQKVDRISPDDGRYLSVYRGKNGALGAVEIGMGVDLGWGFSCQVNDHNYFVTRFGALVWKFAELPPTPTAVPTQIQAQTPSEPQGSSDQSSQSDGSGASDSSQDGTTIESSTDNGQSANDSGCCDGPETPVPTPPPSGGEQTPTPTH